MSDSGRTKRPSDETTALLEQCEAARRDGLQLPQIWNDYLKGHALVIGPPMQQYVDDEPALVIRLITGERLICTRAGYSVAAP